MCVNAIAGKSILVAKLQSSSSFANEMGKSFMNFCSAGSVNVRAGEKCNKFTPTLNFSVNLRRLLRRIDTWYQILNNRHDNYTTMQLSKWFELEIIPAAWCRFPFHQQWITIEKEFVINDLRRWRWRGKRRLKLIRVKFAIVQMNVEDLITKSNERFSMWKKSQKNFVWCFIISKRRISEK